MYVRDESGAGPGALRHSRRHRALPYQEPYCQSYIDFYFITVCPRSGYPFYIVSYYIKWVTPSWTHSMT